MNKVGFGLPLAQCVGFIEEVTAGKVTSTPETAPLPDATAAISSYVEWEKTVTEATKEADVQDVLMDAMEIEDATDLLSFDWDDPSGSSSSSVAALVRASASRRAQVVARISIGESILPQGIPRKLEEVRLKAIGEIWDIHLNDADPFPSNPHAHNVQTSVKLDLSTGDLYRKRAKLSEKIRRKDLIALRALATAKGVELPVLAV